MIKDYSKSNKKMYLASIIESQMSIINQTIVKESIRMLLLFALTIFIVYKLPREFGFIFVISIVIIFWVSKNEYFWFAFFFIIICCPGNFFLSARIDSLYRLPPFSIGTDFTFSTHEIFMMAALLKAFVFGRKYCYILAKPLKLILFYAIFLLLLSMTIYGVSFDTWVFYLRNFIFYSYFISFPALVKKREEIIKFIWLPFPIMFFTFFTAVYFFIHGGHFLYLFDPGSLRDIHMLGGISRFGMFGGEHILVLFCFIFSLFFSILKNNKNIYLISVGFISYLSILMTATRVWFIVYTFIFLIFLYKIKAKHIRRAIILLLTLIVLIYSLYNQNLVTERRIESTSERLASVFYLGDPRSESTQSFEYKSKVKLPKVFEGIKENPIFGWGFSDRAMEIVNADVGNFALIGQVGIIGFLLFIYFWLSYFKLLLLARKRLFKKDRVKDALLILGASFFGFLIAHFTTHQFFGLTRFQYDIFFISAFIFLSEFFIKEAIKFGKSRQLNKPI